ncbi:MAG: hypothetical protein R3D43_02535 [Tepidamorphaceae bacterium]
MPAAAGEYFRIRVLKGVVGQNPPQLPRKRKNAAKPDLERMQTNNLALNTVRFVAAGIIAAGLLD